MTQASEPPPNQTGRGVIVGNLGEPIKLTELHLRGVSAESARSGESLRVCTRLALTSDDRFFHRIVENISDLMRHRATQAGCAINLDSANTILLVIHPDNTGDLWVDKAAVSLKILSKRSISAGMVIFENDIADVAAMSFPRVEISKKDRVVCIFREGWRFALFFDFNPNGELSVEHMERDLGTLYRRLKYRDIYDAIADEKVFGRVIEAGWFPFVEIIGREFRQLADLCEAGFELDEFESKLLSAFDVSRVEKMFTRWMAKPHFLAKEKMLRSALNNFASGDSVAVLKIVLTEIEGILGDAYRKAYGSGARLKILLEFAIQSAERNAGQPDTLLFPAAFARYLNSHTFAKFDPVAQTGKASSRHAVGHGQADADSYTQVRALQALLTLDQLAFYT